MRIFDSFIFFNELELLEMRLNILGDVVDKFVLTESPFTVSGNEKPLYYEENKDKFAKFSENWETHPYSLNRVRMLLNFYHSPEYNKLSGDPLLT